MTKTTETLSSRNPEPLEKAFHVLFGPTMVARLTSHATNLKISKGALIRQALDNYFRNL